MLWLLLTRLSKILQDNLVNFDGFTASAPLPKKLEAKLKFLLSL
jgi:hypothetical protein